MKQSFRIPSATTAGKAFPAILALVLLAFAVSFAFRIPDSPVEATIGLIIILPIAGLFVWLLARQSGSTLVLTGDDLSLNVPWYARRVALSDIDTERVRLLGEAEAGNWQLKWRTNGIGFPGFQVGWFSSENREKVLAARTQGQAVLIPTTKGFTMLVSLEDPQAFVDALHGRWHGESQEG